METSFFQRSHWQGETQQSQVAVKELETRKIIQINGAALELVHQIVCEISICGDIQAWTKDLQRSLPA